MLKSYFVFEEREHYLEEPHALSPSRRNSNLLQLKNP